MSFPRLNNFPIAQQRAQQIQKNLSSAPLPPANRTAVSDTGKTAEIANLNDSTLAATVNDKTLLFQQVNPNEFWLIDGNGNPNPNAKLTKSGNNTATVSITNGSTGAITQEIWKLA